jgi:arylsulfatase A-like enzyme
MGRSILRSDEQIMPQYFAAAGYQTGMFGKWHLGDNYPYRPHDRGFQQALYSLCGGVGQSADYWGNDYFGDTYMRGGQREKQTGYCTDVWFANATRFIEQRKGEPWFCYVATNAAHSPYNVDPKYSQPYVEKGVPQPMANFYGMIANIDENVSRLLGKLDELKLAENTIVIFMTDNGTAAGVQRQGQGQGPRGKGKQGKQAGQKTRQAGRLSDEGAKWTGFNAAMRGQKGSQYEGGHRVPCFVRWPAKIKPASAAVPREVGALAAHFDLLPTLLDLCNLEAVGFDGQSLRHELGVYEPGDEAAGAPPPRLPLVVHSQRVDFPEKWRKCAVMDGDGKHQWRLVDGKELYDLKSDPGQQTDVAAEHAEVVARLREHYEKWWADVSQRFDEYSDIPLGVAAAPVQELTCHDWHPADPPTTFGQSSQGAVAQDPYANGVWAVAVERPGKYEFTLRMRPEYVSHPLPACTARVKLGDATAEVAVAKDAPAAVVVLELKPTKHAMLQTWLEESDGKSRGAFYVTARRVE